MTRGALFQSGLPAGRDALPWCYPAHSDPCRCGADLQRNLDGDQRGTDAPSKMNGDGAATLYFVAMRRLYDLQRK